MTEMALAWVLRRPELASGDRRRISPGAGARERGASGIELSADVLAAIDEALGDVPVSDQRIADGGSAGVMHR